jgi:type VI protein secretion system component Hcp
VAEDVYLRFEGIKGDCLDLMHPGDFDKIPRYLEAKRRPKKDGWIAIQSFTFKFGWGMGDDDKKAGGLSKEEKETMKKNKVPDAEIAKLDKKRREEQQKDTTKKKDAKKDGKSDKDETLGKAKFSFNKLTDAASDDLMARIKAKEDREISRAVVEMCRPAAADASKKDAFLRLIFENVIVTDCKLDVSSDPVPKESVEFHYDKVTMQSIWTYNTSGKEDPGGPNTAGWDFEKKTLYAASPD